MPFPVGFNVREFGALGDGVTLDTVALNRAVQACHTAGGGTVVVPAGVYLTGTIELLSGTTLRLEAGAVLKGSPNVDDYRVLPFSSEGRNTALIVAVEARDIAIIGDGTVDGNGDAFAEYGRADLSRDFVARYTRQGERYCEVNDAPDDGPVMHKRRPGILVLLLRCRDVEVADITVLNAPNWCLHVACSEEVRLTGLEIRSSLLLPNSDGIDVSLCRNVRISDCNISAGDDGIALSPCADGFGPGLDENIVVRNCVISSRSAAIRIGPGDHSFRNLLFENIIIRDSNRGIGLFIRKGESIENISFSNIVIETRLYKGKWWGKAEMIHISAVSDSGWSWGKAAPEEARPTRMGRVRNVTFNHVIGSGDTGVVLWACAESRIEDVRFSNVRLTLTGGPLQEAFGGNFDFRPVEDEALKVFAHDVPGVFARGVTRLLLEHVTVGWRGPKPSFCRHAVEIEQFSDLEVNQLRVQRGGALSATDEAEIVLRDGHGAAIRQHASMAASSSRLTTHAVDGLVVESPGA